MRFVTLFALLAACSYEPRPANATDGDACISTAEACNGVDDDCDGQTDEGFAVGMPCDGDDADSCMEGETQCDGSCSDTSGSNVEVCNGTVDEDCNGMTDCADPACTQGEYCCEGQGLVHKISNNCNTDFGTSGSSDEVEVYCCEGQARFCLSKEACPWRNGCPAGNTKTCSRAGLPTDLMATATCERWKNQSSYSCNADEQITFP